MQEFLDYVIRNLIDFPEEMILSKAEAGKKTVFRLRLRQSDVGKVIGKHGHTIVAIRNLLAAAASRHGEKVVLEIVEDVRVHEQPSPHSSTASSDPVP